jgi:hypothetical protein
LPQKCELATEFIKHSDEALSRRPIGRVDLSKDSKCLDDQIDGSIVQMQPTAVGQQSDLSSLSH